MPTGLYPYPTGQDWLQMGNQAVALGRGIQQTEAFAQDRATNEKAAEYTAEMARNPEFVPDQNAQGYNPIAEIKARNEWSNLDERSRKAKVDQYKQAYTEKRQLANDLFWKVRLAKQQGQSANPDLTAQIVDSFRTLNNRFMTNGVYAGQPGADGTIQMISQTNGKVMDTIDPKKVTMDQLEQFLAMQLQENPQDFVKGMMAEDRAIRDFNADALSRPYIMGKAGGGANDIIFKFVLRDKTTGELVTKYRTSDGQDVPEDEVGEYSLALGRYGDDVELAQAGRAMKMKEAETGMTAAQRADKGLRERDLDIKERGLENKEGMTPYQQAQVGIGISKEQRERDKAKREESEAPQKAHHEAVKAYTDYLDTQLDPSKALSFNEWKAQMWDYTPGNASGSGQGVSGQITKPRKFRDNKTGRTYIEYPDGKIGLPNGKKVTKEEFMTMIGGQ